MASDLGFSLRFQNNQTLNILSDHPFVATSFVQGNIRRHPDTKAIYFPALDIEFFRKYLSYLDNTADPSQEDLPEIYRISDYLSDVQTTEKVENSAARVWEFKDLKSASISDVEDPILNKFWSNVYYQKLRSLSLEEWKKQIETVQLDPSMTISALLKVLSSGEHDASDTPLLLAALYEKKSDPFDALLADYPIIQQELSKINHPVIKERIFWGLIELSIYLLRKKVGLLAMPFLALGFYHGISILNDYDSYHYNNPQRNRNSSSFIDSMHDQFASRYSSTLLKLVGF